MSRASRVFEGVARIGHPITETRRCHQTNTGMSNDETCLTSRRPPDHYVSTQRRDGRHTLRVGKVSLLRCVANVLTKRNIIT